MVSGVLNRLQTIRPIPLSGLVLAYSRHWSEPLRAYPRNGWKMVGTKKPHGLSGAGSAAKRVERLWSKA